jgi:hypothetical protein
VNQKPTLPHESACGLNPQQTGVKQRESKPKKVLNRSNTPQIRSNRSQTLQNQAGIFMYCTTAYTKAANVAKQLSAANPV